MKSYRWKETECAVCGKKPLKEWVAGDAGMICCSDSCLRKLNANIIIAL